MVTNILKRETHVNIFVIKWLAYWLITMGAYPAILRDFFNITYQNSPLFTVAYFLTWGFLGAYLFSFKNIKEELLKQKSQLLLLSLSFIAFVIAPPFIDSIKPLSSSMITTVTKWKFMFPLFEFSTTVSKLADIIFQQLLVLGLVLFLKDNCKNKKETIALFTVVFFILHIPLFIVFKFSVALIFILPSLLAGILFSFSILNFKHGILGSFLIHQGFYITVGLICRLY